jgi:hypothetical protein
MAERDETPTKIQVISDRSPWANTFRADNSRDPDQEPGRGRPLRLDEEVMVPRWQAELLKKNRQAVIIGR